VKQTRSGQKSTLYYWYKEVNMEEKVRKLIEEEVNKLGVNIDSVVYEKEGSNYFLRIVIDRDEIIDLDTCVEVTNVINPILDKVDFIPDSYILDVTTKEKGEGNE
jgi:ribosome maturation factor RimP